MEVDFGSLFNCMLRAKSLLSTSQNYQSGSGYIRRELPFNDSLFGNGHKKSPDRNPDNFIIQYPMKNRGEYGKRCTKSFSRFITQ